MAATDRPRPGVRALHGRSSDDLCLGGIQPKPGGGYSFGQPFTLQRHGEPNSSPCLADSDTEAKSISRSDAHAVAQAVRRLLDDPGSRRDHDRALG
jgi:hypothetical protein